MCMICDQVGARNALVEGRVLRDDGNLAAGEVFLRFAARNFAQVDDLEQLAATHQELSVLYGNLGDEQRRHQHIMLAFDLAVHQDDVVRIGALGHDIAKAIWAQFPDQLEVALRVLEHSTALLQRAGNPDPPRVVINQAFRSYLICHCDHQWSALASSLKEFSTLLEDLRRDGSLALNPNGWAYILARSAMYYGDACQELGEGREAWRFYRLAYQALRIGTEQHRIFRRKLARHQAWTILTWPLHYLRGHLEQVLAVRP